MVVDTCASTQISHVHVCNCYFGLWLPSGMGIVLKQFRYTHALLTLHHANHKSVVNNFVWILLLIILYEFFCFVLQKTLQWWLSASGELRTILSVQPLPLTSCLMAATRRTFPNPRVQYSGRIFVSTNGLGSFALVYLSSVVTIFQVIMIRREWEIIW